MKALIVFVEGAADAFYVQRCLGQVAAAEFHGGSPATLPTPFGQTGKMGDQAKKGHLLTWNTRAGSANRTVAQSSEEEEPVYHAAVKIPKPSDGASAPDWVFLVRMGGDRNAPQITKFLAQLREIFDSPIRLDIKHIACAFLFDADTPQHYGATASDCVALRERRFAEEYQDHFRDMTLPTHAQWTKGIASACSVGLFVFHDTATRSGTLEHWLIPALSVDAEWEARLKDAEALLHKHEKLDDPVCKKESDRLKARITIAGQWQKPGDSLAQILRKGKGPLAVPDTVFQAENAKALVRFLVSAPF